VGKLNGMRLPSRAKLFLIWVLVLASFLAACTPDQNETFIQGRWYHNDPHLLSKVGETYAETFWTFDRGTYETYTCCFVKYQQSGRYTILESEGDTLILEFFYINGKPNSERFQVGVKVDPESDTIRIQGSGPYERIWP
jgi:hypothetical protein